MPKQQVSKSSEIICFYNMVLFALKGKDSLASHLSCSFGDLLAGKCQQAKQAAGCQA